MRNLNPDIVMVEDHITGDSTRGTIHVIEVGFCWQSRWVVKQKETEDKHEGIVEALSSSEWNAKFTVLPVGAMGVSVDFMERKPYTNLD